MTNFLGVPVMIRGHAWGNLYLTEKDEGEFDEADEQSAVILAEWAAIAVDNARLYRNVEVRRDEMERAVHRLEATTEIARRSAARPTSTASWRSSSSAAGRWSKPARC